MKSTFEIMLPVQEPIIKCLKHQKRLRLIKLIQCAKDDTKDEFKVGLGRARNAEIITYSPPGDYNLIQWACKKNLPDHLEAMLEIDGEPFQVLWSIGVHNTLSSREVFGHLTCLLPSRSGLDSTS